MTSLERHVHTEPTEAQLAQLQSLPMAAPLAALNLFKLNERAQYQPEDPEFDTPLANVSGEEAFGRYLVEAGEKLADLGGRVVFSTTVDQVMMGSDDLDFDLAAVMYFPTRSAFLAMSADPAFQSSSRHRRAGLAKHNMLHLDGDPFINTTR
jgi:uncharacterized protein (DUF1330 family)